MEKTELIAKLKAQSESVGKILDLKGYSLINGKVRENLEAIQKEADIIRDKLERNEFEVAVVGLEKAGKSSFCNALIESDFLPSAEKRCTYTSTKIIYSKENKATFSFYSEEEFERDFRDKLTNLGIKNADTYKFSSLKMEDYEKLYEDVSAEKKALYGKSINQEIIDVITYRSELQNYLGRSPISFCMDSEENRKQCRGFIVDSSKAMAVKEAVFETPILENMQNVVIYDVPGFDSPTQMHRIQTRNRMSSADAIIALAAADAPSIKSEALKIFKESDEDGTTLSAKLFVFSNMADRSNELASNINETYKEWGETHKILSDRSRFFFGSANARLQMLNVLKNMKSDDDYVKGMEIRTNELDSSEFAVVKSRASRENGFGVIALKVSLEEYNRTERIKVVQRRYNLLQQRLKTVLGDLSEKCAPLDGTNYNNVSAAAVLTFYTDFFGKVENHLKEHRQRQGAEMNRERHLSKKMVEYITENVTPKKYEIYINDKLKDEKIDLNNYVENNGAMNLPNVESGLRKKLFLKMYNEGFIPEVKKNFSTYHLKRKDEILDIIMADMKVTKESKYYDKIRSELQNELRPYLPSNESADQYQSLIERYSRDIYELLINENYTNNRYERFSADPNSYFSMSVYYNSEADPLDKTVPKESLDKSFCYRMLFHDLANLDSVRAEAEDIVKTKLNLREITPDMAELIFKVVRQDIGGAVKKITDIADKIINENYDASNYKALTKAELKNLSRENVNSIFDVNIDDGEVLTSMYRAESKNYKEMIDNINEDIMILQDILLHGIIRALSLEKPYIAKEFAIVDDIIDHMHSEKFRNFISNHIHLILSETYNELEASRLEQERNAICFREIEQIMNGMDTND